MSPGRSEPRIVSDDVALDLGSAVPYVLHMGVAPEPRERKIMHRIHADKAGKNSPSKTRAIESLAEKFGGGPTNIGRGSSSYLAAVPDTNDHRCFAIDSVSQHVGSGAEMHDELTAVGTVSEWAAELRQLLKPARTIQDGAHGACRSGGVLPDQKIMEPLDIVKCFGQPQEARQSPAFPAAALANAFSRTAASS